jgi:hypothetical protein
MVKYRKKAPAKKGGRNSNKDNNKKVDNFPAINLLVM